MTYAELASLWFVVSGLLGHGNFQCLKRFYNPALLTAIIKVPHSLSDVTET